MTRTAVRNLLLAAAAVVLLTAGVVAQANKQLIVEFFGFQGGRQARADRFLADDYVQHNPRFLKMDPITGARGRQAWVTATEEAARRGWRLVDLPGIPLRNPIILMADGDLAHAVYRGTRPDPDAPGQTDEVFAFEAFRLRNGQFSEHWDQVVLAAGWMTTPTPAAPAPTTPAAPRPAAPPAATTPVVPAPADGCLDTAAAKAANTRAALAFLSEPVTQANAPTRAALLTTDFVSHDPRIVVANDRRTAVGRTGFLRAVQTGIVPRDASAFPRTRDLVIAQCDFVSVVWKQVRPDPDAPERRYEAFTFDTVRLREGLVAEHWSDASR
jgi:predicted SnoaL-like aldol condensation-catalyzing enzyme